MGNPALDLEIQILDLYNNAKSKPGLRRSAAKTVRTHELAKKKKDFRSRELYIFQIRISNKTHRRFGFFFEIQYLFLEVIRIGFSALIIAKSEIRIPNPKFRFPNRMQTE